MKIDKEKTKINSGRRPEWLKAKIPSGENYVRLKKIIEERKLHTVCEEARCPNVDECWNNGTATFLILGDTCTRNCGFCAVKKGLPPIFNQAETKRIAEAVKLIKIRNAVITSVTRDDLFDGGAKIFAETIRQIRAMNPETKIEVLIPDFKGEEFALNIVLGANPDVLAHNMETVARLYPIVRPQANYQRSLELLDRSKRRAFITKTGLMLGLGETIEEVINVMEDLRKVNCDIITLGQYLQPTKENLPVSRFVHPSEFQFLKDMGVKMGFKHVESGPFVRSSYKAGIQI